MDLTVTKVKEIRISQTKEGKEVVGEPFFSITLQTSNGQNFYTAEKNVCSYTVGDKWELKRLESQTTL